MIKKKRSKREQKQLITARRIVEQEGYNINDVESVLTLYQSNEQAKGRSGKVGKYINVRFLLGDKAKQATINVINNSPAFWHVWRELQKEYELSGYDPNYRPQIHRIDSNGDYELNNIMALSRKVHYEKHNKEREKSVQLLAFGANGKLHLGGFESKKKAKTDLDIGEKRLNKMIKGDYDYTNNQGDSMTFVKLVPVDEPLPADFKIRGGRNGNEILENMSKYVQSLKNFQQFDYCEQREKAIDDLSKRLAYYTQRKKQS